MGWLTTEKLFYQEGVLKSIGPSTYKIPSVHDIPREWNIEMINNPNNKVAIRASKAVGEPPLLLAISVWAAIENALSYQRKSLGEPFPKLNVPADSESILAELDPKAYKTMQEL